MPRCNTPQDGPHPLYCPICKGIILPAHILTPGPLAEYPIHLACARALQAAQEEQELDEQRGEYEGRELDTREDAGDAEEPE